MCNFSPHSFTQIQLAGDWSDPPWQCDGVGSDRGDARCAKVMLQQTYYSF